MPDPTYPEEVPTFAHAWALPSVGAKIRAIGVWGMNTRIVRSLQRYTGNRGNLLAGGISYTALFSLAAIITIGVTVTMRLVGQDSTIRNAVFDSISRSLPGVLEWGGHDGIVKPEQMVMNTNVASLAGIIALVTLIFSATRVMTALKTSIRSMFGIEKAPLNPVVDKLRDVVGFIAILLAIGASGVMTAVNSQLGASLLSSLGIRGRVGNALISGASIIGTMIIDMLVVIVLVRVVSNVRARWADMWWGIIPFIVGAAIVRWLGTSAVSAVSSPLLASFAAIITVMLWVNLLARIILISCALIANPPRPAKPGDADHLHANDTPNYVTLSDRETLGWPHLSLTGSVDLDPSRDPDRPVVTHEEPQIRRTPITRWINSRIAYHQRRISYLRRLLTR